MPIRCGHLGPKAHDAGRACFNIAEFTMRNIAPRSPQKDRMVVRLSVSGFIVATRKIAARASDESTAYATMGVPPVRLENKGIEDSADSVCKIWS